MSIKIYNEEDFKGLRIAGRLAAETLDYITDYIKEGVSTLYLNDLCDDFINKHGGISACIGYHGYPKSVCISLNHVICHGIPSEEKKLKNGDILNIDVTVIVNGYYGDTSRMYWVGEPSIKAKRLCDTTYECMMLGIDQVKPDATLGDIGYVIQQYAENQGFSVVRDYCGHGTGRVFHDEPQVLHYGKKGIGTKLQKGMVFTIEPMINAGDYRTTLSKIDGWTVTTKDKSLSAQFEHTMGVTDNGVEIFTLSPAGYTKPPYK